MVLVVVGAGRELWVTRDEEHCDGKLVAGEGMAGVLGVVGWVPAVAEEEEA